MTTTPLQPKRRTVPEIRTVKPPAIFKSFWMGGFESACQVNIHRRRIDMIAATQHDRLAADDYRLLGDLGMRVARDGVRWHLIEKSPGQYDFSSFEPMLTAALANDIQVVWNLCHYGWPDDIDLFSDAFPERFAAFCAAVLKFIQQHTDEPQIFTPTNEISFMAWGVSFKQCVHPYALGRGWDVKCQLVRATLACMDALWAIDPRTRFCHVDPIIRVVPPRDRPDMAQEAAGQHEAQFDAWDMIAGRKVPELGGAEKYLDIMGVNYYHSNQFEAPDVRLRWEDDPRDDRFIPFHELLHRVYQRYKKPLFIAETSHFGDGRAKWMAEMGQEICAVRRRGIPLEGVCLYPLIDRPDWEDPEHWHNSGLFDLVRDEHGVFQRVIHEPYARELREAQRNLAAMGCV